MKAPTVKTQTIKASDLDVKFDAGGDIDSHIDWSEARRPNLQARRVNVDFSVWMVQSLDREARRLGVTRQSLIKLWLADKLEHLARSA